MLALERRLFADPDLHRVIANSRQVQEEIIRHYRVDPGHIAVIYNGLDHERFHLLGEPERAARKARLGAPAGTPIVLFAGSGFRRKGLAFLVDALSSLKDQATVVWVVGKGSPAPYRRQARRLGVDERLKFSGTAGGPGPLLPGSHGAGPAHHLRPVQQRGPGGVGLRRPGDHHRGQRRRRIPHPREERRGLEQPDDLAGLARALEDYLTKGEAPEVRRGAAAAVAHLSWEATVAQTLTVLESRDGRKL